MLPGKLLFDNFLDDMEPRSFNKMMCDVYEEDNDYIIEVDVPGFEKENIKIECDKGNLKIIAENTSEGIESTKKYIHRERKNYARYERAFYLGNVKEDAIKAEFKNGALKITVPKFEETETKKIIEIQ